MNALAIDQSWKLLDEGQAEAVAAQMASAAGLSSAALVLRGVARFESGDLAGADSDLTAVLATDPANPIARLNRMLVRFRAGRIADCIADYDGGPFFPQTEFLRRFLRVFWPLRFEHDALRVVALDENPNPDPLRAEFEAWRADPAKASPTRAASLSQKFVDAGMKAFAKDNVSLAFLSFQRAYEIRPDDLDRLVQYASALCHVGRFDTARTLLEPVVMRMLDDYQTDAKLDHFPPSMLLGTWAHTLHETGEHRGALAVIARIRPEGPEDFSTHLLAALCWTMLGERQNADRAFDVALHEFFYDNWTLTVEPYARVVRAWLGTLSR